MASEQTQPLQTFLLRSPQRKASYSKRMECIKVCTPSLFISIFYCTASIALNILYFKKKGKPLRCSILKPQTLRLGHICTDCWRRQMELCWHSPHPTTAPSEQGAAGDHHPAAPQQHSPQPRAHLRAQNAAGCTSVTLHHCPLPAWLPPQNAHQLPSGPPWWVTTQLASGHRPLTELHSTPNGGRDSIHAHRLLPQGRQGSWSPQKPPHTSQLSMLSPIRTKTITHTVLFSASLHPTSLSGRVPIPLLSRRQQWELSTVRREERNED